MLKIDTMVFNPFQENTYILYDDSKECIIIDPGMFSPAEQNNLVERIDQLGLKPVKALQTHLHIDHVLGCRFVYEKYGLHPWAHQDDEFFIENTMNYARQFGFQLSENPPGLGGYLNDGEIICFGNSKIRVIHVPGHSPGGVLFYDPNSGILVSGDVLFKKSIGRSDLPGGNQHQLTDGINEKIMVLPDNTNVYPGHGPSTTIGSERESNPFL